MTNFKWMPNNAFGSGPYAYVAQTSSVCWDDRELKSVSPSRPQEDEEETAGKREEEIRQILEAGEHTFTSGFPHRTEVFEI